MQVSKQNMSDNNVWRTSQPISCGVFPFLSNLMVYFLFYGGKDTL